MTPKHTPGPWFVMSDVGPHNEFLISGHPFYDGHPDPLYHATATGDNEANARLIAAAPELLSALEQMLSIYGGSPEQDGVVSSRARAAIAKAKGE